MELDLSQYRGMVPVEMFGRVEFPPIGELPYFKGKGCDTCAGTGLKGRQGLYEVMPMSQNLRRLIVQNAGAQEIKEAAVKEGMLTLRMDGWLKILKGIATIEQVVRETSA